MAKRVATADFDTQLMDRGERLEARIAGMRESRDPWERVRIEVSLEM